MNKAIEKMMVALAVCGALCGTALAAPKGGQPPKGHAPAEQRTHAPKPVTTVKAPVKEVCTPQGREVRRAPAPKPQPRHEVAHNKPHKPAPRHCEPVRPAHRHPEPPRHEHKGHDHHHNGTLHTEDWCSIGASLVGGMLGGLIGAAL